MKTMVQKVIPRAAIKYVLYDNSLKQVKLLKISENNYSKYDIPLFHTKFWLQEPLPQSGIPLDSYASWNCPGIFFGGEAKSTVMQISIVMLIFLLFSDQISVGEQKFPSAKLPRGGRPLPPCGRKPAFVLEK